MIAREYDKRIAFYQTVTVQNEFGGTILSDELLFNSWAKVITDNIGKKAVDFGVTDFKYSVIFKCRYRNDFDYTGDNLFILYKGIRYIIQAVRNIGIRDLEIEILSTVLDQGI